VRQAEQREWLADQAGCRQIENGIGGRVRIDDLAVGE